MYFTDRGLEELEKRRGDEEVTLAWVAERLQEFVDTLLHVLDVPADATIPEVTVRPVVPRAT
jgi:hypothetical protein